MFVVVVTALLSLLCLSSGYLMQGLSFYTAAIMDVTKAVQYDLYRDGVCAYAVAQVCSGTKREDCSLWYTARHGYVMGEIGYEEQGDKLFILVKLLKAGKLVRSCRLEGVLIISKKKGQFTCVRIEDF